MISDLGFERPKEQGCKILTKKSRESEKERIEQRTEGRTKWKRGLIRSYSLSLSMLGDDDISVDLVSLFLCLQNKGNTIVDD